MHAIPVKIGAVFNHSKQSSDTTVRNSDQRILLDCSVQAALPRSPPCARTQSQRTVREYGGKESVPAPLVESS